MILIRGDIHGDIDRFLNPNIMEESVLNKNDSVLVCGDFGFVMRTFYRPEQEALYRLEQKKYNILFVDGNHENHVLLNKFPEEEWHGGRIHRIRKNIIHLMRGQVFEIDDHTFFTMGGAYSIDLASRVEGYSWWPEELPSESDYQEARKNLQRVGMQVDYIITHTAPKRIVEKLDVTPPPEEHDLESFLDWLSDHVSFHHWYFGHFHQDKVIDTKYEVLYNTSKVLPKL